MARVKGSAAVYQQVDAHLAARVSNHPPYVNAANGGRYRGVFQTGLATVLSAHTATAGHWGAFRNPSATKVFVVDFIRLMGIMVTDFTTLQRFVIAARLARAMTAIHTGGTTGTVSGNNLKLRTDYATTAALAQVATTADLTAGTHTIDTQPFLACEIGNASDAATAKRIPNDAIFDGRQSGPIVLEESEGIVFSNEILMGAAGTAHLAFEIGWREVLIADAADL